MSDINITVEIDGDFIELQDDGCLNACIRIDQWQQIKDAVDAELHGKYHHLREIIKNTKPINLD
ncbi:hypothetical protein [Psychrobacter sp. DAB_AL43B]|uniref:hypothetical protein n=1 Tax=Psychrobacter sp. DAB_AL43B TaxID=1028416 RepID=UPI0009A7316B|nr:hypothetical protein [Psychrobacter sp. DAB_AL43B]SLJ84496.1 hypothetical protein DABAL43B_1300 [Psychrobacter sp. DAB_AL43B]